MAILEYFEFLKEASKTLDSIGSKKDNTAVFLMDFIGLPELDGILGYTFVDTLIQHAAFQVRNTLQPHDLVGRVGRHQLACLFTKLPNQEHAQLAAYKLLRLLMASFHRDKRRIIFSARIGITTTDMPSKTDITELMRQANAAMYYAMKDKEILKIYTPEMDKVRLSELELLGDLDGAIDESRIFMAYQPQLCLKSNKIIGAEALLRWTHPQWGAVPPENMIRLAENTGIITKLTYWVFNTTMRECASYRKFGQDLSVSVNFSANNMRETDLVGIVSQALELWRVPPEKIVIELTETAIMDVHEQTINTLKQFKDMGLKISMDDFGTGYSSMSLLQKLPIDEIKIDRSFTCNMLAQPKSEKIIDSIIDLAHKLNMEVVAEGVDNESVVEKLKEFGCDYIQGYIIGHPMVLDKFIAMTRQFNA